MSFILEILVIELEVGSWGYTTHTIHSVTLPQTFSTHCQALNYAKANFVFKQHSKYGLYIPLDNVTKQLTFRIRYADHASDYHN